MRIIPAVLITVYVIELLVGYSLVFLNIRHLRKHGTEVPPEFEGTIDQALLTRTRNYAVEHMRFGVVVSLWNSALVLVFIFGGVLSWYAGWISSLNLPFIPAGLVFFLLLSALSAVLSAPFGLFRAFRIENKYGFNTMTLSVWIGDLFKSFAISSMLMAILVAGGLWLVETSPQYWWLWVWALFFVFSIVLMYISPYVIEPLFNKFSPVEDEVLAGGIRALARKAGIRVSRIFRMDASKRTRHTNAYFTGIGRVKRIVLYDTLLSKMERNEILAVLAHEIGHWKKKHLLKYLAIMEILSLAGLYAAFLLIEGGMLSRLFGIEASSFYADVVLLMFLGSLVMFPVRPLFSALSRRHEREADRFSRALTGDAEGMISTLVKLSRDNLSNLHPHPLYAAFHYSHPPVLARIRELRAGTDEGRGTSPGSGEPAR